MLHYNPKLKVNDEVWQEKYGCLDRLTGKIDATSKIDAQIEDFKSKYRFFGTVTSQHALKSKTAAWWWELFVHKHLEIQNASYSSIVFDL